MKSKNKALVVHKDESFQDSFASRSKRYTYLCHIVLGIFNRFTSFVFGYVVFSFAFTPLSQHVEILELRAAQQTLRRNCKCTRVRALQHFGKAAQSHPLLCVTTADMYTTGASSLLWWFIQVCYRLKNKKNPSRIYSRLGCSAAHRLCPFPGKRLWLYATKDVLLQLCATT